MGDMFTWIFYQSKKQAIQRNALLRFSAFDPSDSTDGVRFLLTGGEGDLSRVFKWCKCLLLGGGPVTSWPSWCCDAVDPTRRRSLLVIDLRNLGPQFPNRCFTEGRPMDELEWCVDDEDRIESCELKF